MKLQLIVVSVLLYLYIADIDVIEDEIRKYKSEQRIMKTHISNLEQRLEEYEEGMKQLRVDNDILRNRLEKHISSVRSQPTMNIILPENHGQMTYTNVPYRVLRWRPSDSRSPH